MRSVPKSTRRTGCGTTRRWCSRVPVEFSRRGLCGNARLPRRSKLASAAPGPAKGRDVEFAAAFALAVSGELSKSQRLAEDLAKRFQEDPPVRFEYLPTLHALFALSQKAPTDHREAPSAGGQAHLQEFRTSPLSNKPVRNTGSYSSGLLSNPAENRFVERDLNPLWASDGNVRSCRNPGALTADVRLVPIM